MDTARPCKHCQGTGLSTSSWAKPGEPCTWCEGLGQLPAIDAADILRRITTTRGTKSLRRSFTSYPDRFASSRERVAHHRAYYVWRLARFHGGADVTMPVIASMTCGSDPFRPELDLMADVVAQRVFGTDRAAAYRWAGALGYDVQVPAGLPAAAYAHGPTHDGNKPAEELAEAM
jgi:hypothetical protein